MKKGIGIMKCPNCGNELLSGAKFCLFCGHKVDTYDSGKKLFCNNCGTEIEEGADFCSVCGKRVSSSEGKIGSRSHCMNCGAEIPENETLCDHCKMTLNKGGTGNRKNELNMKAILIIALIVAFAAAGLVGYIIYSSARSGDDSASGTPVPTAMPTATVTVPPTEAPQPTENMNTQLVTYYVVNCRENISLRQSPSNTATVLKTIPLGQPVSYVEPAQNGFAKVIYNGTTGYALQSYLSISPPDMGAAVNIPPDNNRPPEKPASSGVVSYPSYSTYSDSDYNFSCSYPSHFRVYNEKNNFMRYTLSAPDDTATLKICATSNSSWLSVSTVAGNFKSSYPGSTDYENSGADWCAVRTYKNGWYHYGYFKLTNNMIRGFEFHFNSNYFDIYDRYINDIYNSFKFY